MKIPVNDFLSEKGRGAMMINKSDSVYNALVKMAQKDVGALLVEDNDKLIGIFSERDYARKVVLHGKTSKESTVGEMMSTELTVVGLNNTMRECMALMSQKKIRHIPVVEDDKLVGVVSIGDVVNRVIKDQESTIKDLENYIYGGAYGAKVEV